jgi:hypothetical protein
VPATADGLARAIGETHRNYGLMSGGEGRRGVAEWPKLPRPSSTLQLTPARSTSRIPPLKCSAMIDRGITKVKLEVEK